MDMTSVETVSAAEPRPWDSFKGSEKAFMTYFSRQGLQFVRGWLQQSEHESTIDQSAFGLSTQDMQVLALRVARHLTGAQPIPELEGKRPAVGDVAMRHLVKTIRTDLDRLGQSLTLLEASTLSAFPAAVQEAKKALAVAQSRVRGLE